MSLKGRMGGDRRKVGGKWRKLCNYILIKYLKRKQWKKIEEADQLNQLKLNQLKMGV